MSPVEVFLALAGAWQLLTGSMPDRRIIHIIHAQSALETRHWKSIINYNLGGIKKTAGCDWTYFTTPERLPTGVADKYLASSKPGAEVTMLKVEPGFKTLRFSGKQPTNCFASWENLNESAAGYIKLLIIRYPSAIEAAKRGDVKAYVHELKIHGYFTAAEDVYAKDVSSIAASYEKKLAGVQFPTVITL